MSRHRNVRSMNYSDEYDGYDDVYGHSVEDDYTISPSDAAFMYDRNHQPQMSAFLAEEDDIAEEDESELDSNNPGGVERRDSETYLRPQLSDIDEARLLSCIEEIRNVIGDTVSEQALVDTILKHDFNLNLSLDAILSSAASSAQCEDSNSKRPREKKDTGKDQDDDPRQLSSEKSSTDVALLRAGISNLNIKPPALLPDIKSENIDTQLSIEFAKRLNTVSSNTTAAPKFQFKSISKFESDDSSGDDEEGSLSALMAKHQMKKQPASRQFLSLTDLANQHLNSKQLIPRQQFGGIVPPATNLSSNEPEQFPNSVDGNDFKIDLSCALKANSSRPSNTTLAEKESLTLQTDFIDDFVMKTSEPVLQKQESFDCAMNATSILHLTVPRRKQLSSFGKVVCRRWLKRDDPMLRRSFREPLHEIVSFDFNTPSPDDIIKRHIRRN